MLHEVLERHRPASAALADWGKSHRFAGSGDRSAIGNLVFDALRRKASAADRMHSDAPRALVLGSLAMTLTPDQIAALCDASQHAPAHLSEAELQCLREEARTDLRPWIAGNYPEWLQSSLSRAFGGNVVPEGKALAERAPVDLRVNTLKAERDTVLAAMAAYAPEPTRYSPLGIRLRPPQGSARQPNVEADAEHGRGWFEVQDEGSQIAAALAGATPGQTVLDLCAGAGGKTLALAAAMRNQGRVYAYDSDKMRLRPIFERLQRAGVTCVDVMTAGDRGALSALGGACDLVLVDAPCSGTGPGAANPTPNGD